MKKFLLLLVVILNFTVQTFSQINSIFPNIANQGQSLTTTITLAPGVITGASAPLQYMDIYLQQGANIIYCAPGYSALLDWSNVWDPFQQMYVYGDSGNILFNIPSNAPMGPYDVIVNTYNNPWTGPTINTLPGGFTIGDSYGTIEGRVYFDLNQNGIEDAGDFPLNNIGVQMAPLNHIVYTNSLGEYKYYVDSGTYVSSVILPTNYTQTSLPTNYTTTVPPFVTGQDFGIYSASYAYNHSVLINRLRTRCNETGDLRITINNLGHAPIQERVTVITSSNYTFVSSSTPPASINGDTLSFFIPTINPSTGVYLSNSLLFTAPAAFQIVSITVIDSMFDLSGNFIDASTDFFTYEVRCSYDPNDKHVSPEGTLAQNYTPINSDLTYLINFQNTGNDTAYDVTLFDTLDVNLDPTTFEVMGSSHLVNVQRTPVGELRFNFFNIMLPDSGTDEAGSHGWVLYRVIPVAPLPDPTVITNTAYIVFDMNPPIITNTTMNTMTALQYPVSTFTTGDVSICETNCIMFNNQSTSGTTYQWTFAGGTPSTSTSASPSAICYSTAGSYDVTLITTNALGSDTLTQAAYINVATSPGIFTVVQQGDSLIAPQGYASYEWYYNNVLITGDTLYYHVATQDGDYGVVVSNPNGCQSGVNIPGVITDLTEISDSKQVTIYPNPSSDRIEISYNSMTNENALLSIIDKLGQTVSRIELDVLAGSNKFSMNVNDLASGIYTVQIKAGSKVISKILMIHK